MQSGPRLQKKKKRVDAFHPRACKMRTYAKSPPPGFFSEHLNKFARWVNSFTREGARAYIYRDLWARRILRGRARLLRCFRTQFTMPAPNSTLFSFIHSFFCSNYRCLLSVGDTNLFQSSWLSCSWTRACFIMNKMKCKNTKFTNYFIR